MLDVLARNNLMYGSQYTGWCVYKSVTIKLCTNDTYTRLLDNILYIMRRIISFKVKKTIFFDSSRHQLVLNSKGMLLLAGT